MPVVTIARQIGAQGEEIAAEVARITGARLLDHELLRLASDATGIPLHFFESLDERGRSMIRQPGDLFRLVPLPPINPDLPDVYGDRYPPTGPVVARGEGLQSPVYWALEAYTAAISRVIQLVARDGDAVVVGRGGNEALFGRDIALNVLVIASDPIRVRRVAERERVNLYHALDRVRESDGRRRAFARQFYGAGWLDPARYDLVIRTDAVDIAAAARMIVSAARAPQAEESSAAALASMPAPASRVAA